MLFTEEDFIATVSNKFWKHIHASSLVPIEATEDRVSFLKQLVKKISNKEYSPCLPREYIAYEKQNLVARIVPILNIADYCVYFYCVKKLEEYIALNRVEGTFGGFKMGGGIRVQENEEVSNLLHELDSASPGTFNPVSWKAAWGDYTHKISAYFFNSNFEDFVLFDIANFYDCINLDLLERKLRSAVPREYSEIVNLLFFFLSNWNRIINGYTPQKVGLPQDEVGDCSRILANFYLQDYDAQIKSLCDYYGCTYVRYADDQVVMAKSRLVSKKILYLASLEAAKYGLNINSSKVKFFDRLEFLNYWSFDIFELLSSAVDFRDIECAATLLLERLASSVQIRSYTILSRLISCGLGKMNIRLRTKILSLIMEDSFLSNAAEWQLSYILNSLESSSKSDFLNELNEMAVVINFNKFHYELLRFIQKNELQSHFDLNEIDKLIKVNKPFTYRVGDTI